MIVSMTGFAAVAAELPGVSLSVELRSVNHRYLDLQLRLPDELRASRRRCASASPRSSNAARSNAGSRSTARRPAAAALAIDRRGSGSSPRGERRAAARPRCGAAVGQRDPALAGRAGGADGRAGGAGGPGHDLVRDALRELAAARAREGAKTRLMLDDCCAAIEAQVARVAPRIPAIHAAYLEKLSARLRRSGARSGSRPAEAELALFATKVDVAEEVSRLGTHVAEVRRVLDAGGSAGKRLDFLMQELHREANTLGSKSVDASCRRPRSSSRS